MKLGDGFGWVVQHADSVHGRQERADDLELTVRRDRRQDARHVGRGQAMFERIEDHHVENRDIRNFRLSRQRRLKTHCHYEGRIRRADLFGKMFAALKITA
jgi:hypothetical protein